MITNLSDRFAQKRSDHRLGIDYCEIFDDSISYTQFQLMIRIEPMNNIKILVSEGCKNAQ